MSGKAIYIEAPTPLSLQLGDSLQDDQLGSLVVIYVNGEHLQAAIGVDDYINDPKMRLDGFGEHTNATGLYLIRAV